ncbi:conserved hypothetical protein [Candida dubliniensis CD36]|uniref:Uncharacterized protein n=1 Tax=Candida dubliniensis (strain CD36 / ATCC MYA-646 / CBS 7987 / NCPF 3949 / NRRL Y-17841) TaxID=573826 RepID=B9W7Y2_CANDC|nr:conserved hypothetical protein [Candida dubliniensis CD36]CAX44795.1 conserved hypothetical protein [Candida dubliniensis CD36]
MVTASELNQLNVWNDKNEGETRSPQSYIPDSINWMIGSSKICNTNNSSPTTNLRNKRLHYLFKNHQSASRDQASNGKKNSNSSGSVKEDAESSIDYPTTQLNTHELTSKLELELVESSFLEYGRKTMVPNEFSHRSKERECSFDSKTCDINCLNSISVGNSLPSEAEGSSFLQSTRDIESGNCKADPHQEFDIQMGHSHENISIHSNPRKHVRDNNTMANCPKPVKRFKSKSQCDLVFPNLNFRNSG